ncbi:MULTISPECIES: hypothetical protein [unclassified Streptomyces]|uniref:hypothetical protein n=1 Tax=unclassified Streptomyces TaxID=2593676 RepID=UPI00278BF30C|nr:MULTISPECIES: hypothetical protein [unclassified Streptomyces]
MIRSNRIRRQAVRARRAQSRAQARIRRGPATLATHAIAAGLGVKAARTVAASLRKAAAKLGVVGVTGVAYRKGRARACVRYTRQQVAVIVTVYRPRKPAYVLAASKLALAA